MTETKKTKGQGRSEDKSERSAKDKKKVFEKKFNEN